ncbi:MAG: type II toxin-antitoxin system RelE/ParE family toxin [Dehalococcoidia bacterium]|nr:type II toxin-antitoxin system RelE/ParE family toxin [Dehalococcoidia bacterium]
MDVVYYEDRRGHAPVEEYVEAIVAAGEGIALARFRRGLELLAEFGQAVGMPHTRMIDRTARLYELRFGDHRVAYISHAGAIVLLHGWRKRSQRLDEQEAARARRNAEDWRQRR